MPEIQFGDWVLVNAILKRTKDEKGYNRWIREELRVPLEGIFLGKRTLWDSCLKGDVSYGMDGPDYEYYIDNENPKKGAIVCQKNRAPIKVLFSDLERIKQHWEVKFERFAVQAVDILRQV